MATLVIAGGGSAPALSCRGVKTGDNSLPPAFADAFGKWTAAVAFLACQDRAVTMAQRLRRVAAADISLPIPRDQVQAMIVTPGSAHCSLLSGEIGEPFAFVVPRVKFRVLSEHLI